MLTFEFPLSRLACVKARHHWFHARPAAADACGLAIYYHCRHTGPVPGFRRTPKFTKFVDLRQTEEEIFNAFGKDTRHKLKRGIAEGLRFSLVEDRNELRDTYNEFARAKRLPLIEERVLTAYWPRLLATKLSQDGKVLVMHAYLLDPDGKRACQSHAAALFRTTDDRQQQNLIGRANRLLHYLEMLALKERRFEVFDIGGYALNTTDPELQEVNAFKDSFGGKLVEESVYTSLPLLMLRGFSGWLRGVPKRQPLPTPSKPQHADGTA